MANLERIRQQLASHEPRIVERDSSLSQEAAVALVLHQSDGGSPELLFIERARRVGDPWSGHMAFPGGRRDPGDADLAATAARETLEEVGLALGAPICRLDDFAGARGPSAPNLIVSPHVYAVERRPELVMNAEVKSTVWVPLDWILKPESASEHVFERERQQYRAAACRYQTYTIWGLTYRILCDFFLLLGRELPSYQPPRLGE
jgi:8-oxo-dGTP pyrophosphatase MutT (NUDIX family)